MLNSNTNNNIINLKNKFTKFKELGYIKCNNYDSGTPGRMFETLLNKKTDNLRLPDYDDIEIKALLKKNHYDLTLFSIIPQLDNMSFDQIISYFFRTFFYENINLKGKIVNPKFIQQLVRIKLFT